ncbi:MAG TPA: response regulator transcription factor [Rhizomicrobium sp.]|nr:response regulator transcription factor [Rhizomicrobium sp.]
MSPDLKPLIVVAEDDEAIRSLIMIQLDAAGFRTEGVCDGVEALEKIRNAMPAGVVLDIGMPKMDGFDVLEAMQVAGLSIFIPILVLTARHAEGDVRRAIELGATDFLAKPFDGKMLQTRVRRMLDMDLG